MKRLVLSALVFAALSSPVFAQQIGGNYAVQGTNLDGSTYSGTATITLTSDYTCEIVWVTGGSTSQGICMKNQNAFAAGYTLGSDVGLVVYEIKSDGSMEGLWTIAGVNSNGTETLTPMK